MFLDSVKLKEVAHSVKFVQSPSVRLDEVLKRTKAYLPKIQDRRFLLQDLIGCYLYGVKNTLKDSQTVTLKYKKTIPTDDHPHKLTCMCGFRKSVVMSQVDATRSSKHTGLYVTPEQFKTVCRLTAAALQDNVPVDIMSWGGGEKIGLDACNVAFFDFDLKLKWGNQHMDLFTNPSTLFQGRIKDLFLEAVHDFVPTELLPDDAPWRAHFKVLVTVPKTLRFYAKKEKNGTLWCKTGAHYRCYHDEELRGGPFFPSLECMYAFRSHLAAKLEKEFPQDEYKINWDEEGCDEAPMKNGVAKFIGAQKNKENDRIRGCKECFQAACEDTSDKSPVEKLRDAQAFPFMNDCACLKFRDKPLEPVVHHVVGCFNSHGQSLLLDRWVENGHPTADCLVYFDNYVAESLSDFQSSPEALVLTNKLGVDARKTIRKVKDITDENGVRVQERSYVRLPKHMDAALPVHIDDHGRARLQTVIRRAFPYVGDDVTVREVLDKSFYYEVRLQGTGVKKCVWKGLREEAGCPLAHSNQNTYIAVCKETTKSGMRKGCMYHGCFNTECQQYVRKNGYHKQKYYVLDRETQDLFPMLLQAKVRTSVQRSVEKKRARQALQARPSNTTMKSTPIRGPHNKRKEIASLFDNVGKTWGVLKQRRALNKKKKVR